MLKVRGIYDGEKLVLLDPVPIPPHTTVEVWIAEGSLDAEQVYWQHLIAQGLIKEVRPSSTDVSPFAPVHVAGAPVSQTIIEERR